MRNRHGAPYRRNNSLTMTLALLANMADIVKCILSLLSPCDSSNSELVSMTECDLHLGVLVGHVGSLKCLHSVDKATGVAHRHHQLEFWPVCNRHHFFHEFCPNYASTIELLLCPFLLLAIDGLVERCSFSVITLPITGSFRCNSAILLTGIV